MTAAEGSVPPAASSTPSNASAPSTPSTANGVGELLLRAEHVT